jgi:biopolymer transport protein ExbB
MKPLVFVNVVIFFVLCSFGALAVAQEESGASYSRIWDWFKEGGVLMYPIAFCSLLSLAIVLERIFALQRRKTIPPRFLKDLQGCWQRGDIHAVLPLCQQSESSLTRVLEAGFRRIDLGLLETERAIEAAGQHEISLLTSNLRLLGAVAVVTPMLGLLGTVTGMIKAFENIALSGTGNPNLMATGIAEALTTTAAGLIVAIPSLAAYHFIRGRVDRLVYEMEEIATTLLATLPEKDMIPAKKETNDEISQTAGGGVSSGFNSPG